MFNLYIGTINYYVHYMRGIMYAYVYNSFKFVSSLQNYLNVLAISFSNPVEHETTSLIEI